MRANPVSPLAPVTLAVYGPGSSVTRSAESDVAELPHEKAPTQAAVEAICASPPQPVFEATSVLPDAVLYTCSLGSGSVPGTPNGARAGPDARMRTVFGVMPPITNPTIRLFAPLPAAERA